MLALLDTVDWPTAFLGAIKAGVIPIRQVTDDPIDAPDLPQGLTPSESALSYRHGGRPR